MGKRSPNATDTHVGSRVRLRRNMLSMSQRALGEALGVSFQQLQRYENGTDRIWASRLQQISHVLEVPVALLRRRAAYSGAADIAGPASVAGPIDRFHENARRASACQGVYADRQRAIEAADR
jgi:transcriptional regulator with XRE-family HTH domain